VRLPDAGELVSIVLLGIIAIWGVWFGLQSLLALWWPLNVGYGLAGALVASLSCALAWAILTARRS
jgi:hypothetical protein